MNTHLLCLFTAAVSVGASASGQIWINELHYDNGGTDVGEFVEVAAPAGFSDLASVRLTLYNGGDGRSYGTSHSLDSFTPGITVSGMQFYSKVISGMQNGPSDGLSLDIGGSVIQFLSYEGTFAAANGPAGGMTSTDIGVGEGDATAVGTALGLAGTGSDYLHFSWNAGLEATPGGPNGGQFVVPEPRTTTLAAMLAVVGWLTWRRGRATDARS